jgi:hypothetical protein
MSSSDLAILTPIGPKTRILLLTRRQPNLLKVAAGRKRFRARHAPSPQTPPTDAANIRLLGVTNANEAGFLPLLYKKNADAYGHMSYNPVNRSFEAKLRNKRPSHSRFVFPALAQFVNDSYVWYSSFVSPGKAG